MTKVKPNNENNENETKSDMITWNILKSEVIAFLITKKISIIVFQWFSKSKFLSFMTKVNRNNGNETK